MFWRYKFLFLLLPLSICACSKSDSPLFSKADALIFGTFYGECFGDDCVRTYMVSEGILYKDANDAYVMNSRSFEKVSDDGADIALKISEKMTSGLGDIVNSSIGCPDCRDQGGVYLETVDSDEVSTYWIFDQDKSEVAEEFHPLLDIINETVRSLD